MKGFKEAFKRRAFLFVLPAFICAFGCLNEPEAGRRGEGREKFISAELINEALESYTAIPEKHMSAGRIVSIRVPRSDRVIVIMENYLSRNELAADLKLQVDDTRVEAGILHIKPSGRKEAEIELPFSMTDMHDIEAVAHFEKPDDLPPFEDYMEFNPGNASKKFVALKPREPGEIVRIGIFSGAGAENTAKYLNTFENARADIIDSLDKIVIARILQIEGRNHVAKSTFLVYNTAINR